MTYQVLHHINGLKVNSPQAQWLPIHDPAQAKVIGQVAIAGTEQINQAVQAAKTAFESWSTTTPTYRSRLFFQYKALLEAEAENLAAIITREHGKTLAEALSSVRRGIEVVDYACGINAHLKGVFYEAAATDVDCYSMRQPLGVCLGITPFNFPAMIPLWMFPLAIACGNTFILKPSEKDPSCAQRLVELAELAGFPAGVINIVNGDKETVKGLVQHPDIKAVSFVGSTAVAEDVHRQASMLNKRVQAFGGSKNHCVVMPDADMDLAADNIAQAAYGCAGERCMAISVVMMIGDQTADSLIPKLKVATARIKMGGGTEATSTLGPLISAEHLAKVKSYLDQGLQEGAELLVDGRQDPNTPPQGFFLGCSLFDRVQPQMRIYQEEIFGPVLVLMRIKDLDSALALINAHPYGNGTAIFTRDGYNARTFASKVQVGMVGVNVPVPVPVSFHSFGGWKRSVFADLDLYGAEGLQFYTKLKSVTQRWVKGETWF